MNTQEQQTIIDAPRLPGATLTLAGAGSGKTTTLVNRLIRDAAELDPEKMVVITFTTKAAEELKHRLEKHNLRLGFIGTLHAYALLQIRTAGAVFGYTSQAAILTEEETDRQIKAIISRLALPKAIGPSHVRESLLDPQNPCAKRTPEGLAAFTFRKLCRDSNQVTFETVLAEFLVLIKQGRTPPISALYVDEYQDTAPIDDAIYRALDDANPGLFFFVVGDANQSIYGFRGAEIENIITLAKEARQTFTLSTNFRSAPAIVIAANRLIEHNRTGLPLTMQAADATRQADIHVTTAADRYQEAQEILAWLKGYPNQPRAILTRYNEDADFFAEYFLSKGEPVVRRTRDPLAKARAFVIAALNALIDAKNAAGRQWAETYATERPHLFNRAASEMRPLAEVCIEHAKPTGTIEQIAHALALPAAARWLLKDNWTGDAGQTILALLEPSETTQDATGPGIHVGTIHSAKGLEWDAVAIAGLEQQTTPRTQDRLEEERRLFYVGITRARHALHLSSAARNNDGKTTTQSQFISEAI